MSQDDIISAAQNAGRQLLTEVESKQLLSQAGIETNETLLAKSKDEAIELSRQIGFPAVLKIASPDVIHKSDAGGVKIGLANDDEVGQAYDEILASIGSAYPNAQVDGISVQAMAQPGVEVIMGMSTDPQFGPVLMFGLGGILVEVLKDVAFRIAPLTPRDAAQMIREIKGYPILEGHRGQKPVDVSALENSLLKLSRFVEERPMIRELDLNPVIAYSDGLTVVDARIVLENA
ncbi:MAG: acetate--CoA ligase family protein, partial [Chloroflexi bacterium]|nr:acetate--CoA ligase family protein [Chloroflexota bacterium]